MVLEITLKAVLDLVKSLLSEKAKEKIKGKSSNEKAKEVAFQLYNTLITMEGHSSNFISLLNESIQNSKDIETKEFLASGITKEILVEVRFILGSIDIMMRCLRSMNPQLEIHEFDLVQKIKMYGMMRGAIVKDIHETLQEESPTPADLKTIITQAQENNELLNTSITEFREFLKNEFRFKDSF